MVFSNDDRRRPANKSAYATQASREPSRRETQASASYRSALEKAFSGGKLPHALQERLGSLPVDPLRASQAERCRLVLEASSPKALASAAGQLLAPSVQKTASQPALVACLGSENIAHVVTALTLLREMVETASIQRPKVLRARLETLAIGSDVKRIRDEAKRLAQYLKTSAASKSS